MQPETIGIIAGSGFAVVNISIFWVREWRKHRTWRANGKDLTEIKKDVKDMVGKIGRVKTDVTKIKTRQDEQVRACDKTVTRFDAAIIQNQKQLLEIVKDK